jgi:hypothetical protein
MAEDKVARVQMVANRTLKARERVQVMAARVAKVQDRVRATARTRDKVVVAERVTRVRIGGKMPLMVPTAGPKRRAPKHPLLFGERHKVIKQALKPLLSRRSSKHCKP